MHVICFARIWMRTDVLCKTCEEKASWLCVLEAFGSFFLCLLEIIISFLLLKCSSNRLLFTRNIHLHLGIVYIRSTPISVGQIQMKVFKKAIHRSANVSVCVCVCVAVVYVRCGADMHLFLSHWFTVITCCFSLISL